MAVPPSGGSRRIGKPEDLVSHDEIADRAGVAVATVHKWKQRYDDFPEPFTHLAIGPVWNWKDIEKWLGQRGVGTLGGR